LRVVRDEVFCRIAALNGSNAGVTVLHCDILVNIIIVIIIANVGSCIKSPTKAARLLHGLLKRRPPE
jgi:hypothetical protein